MPLLSMLQTDIGEPAQQQQTKAIF